MKFLLQWILFFYSQSGFPTLLNVFIPEFSVARPESLFATCRWLWNPAIFSMPAILAEKHSAQMIQLVQIYTFRRYRQEPLFNHRVGFGVYGEHSSGWVASGMFLHRQNPRTSADQVLRYAQYCIAVKY
jgi:hypothetical protein